MRRLSVWCRIYLGFAAFSILGTALTRLTGLDPGPIKPAAAALTLLIGVIAVFEPIFKESGRKKGLLSFLAVIAIGVAAEVTGLYTGLPFGRYEYTDRWWPTVLLPGSHYFPLLLPFAWALLVGGYFSIPRTFAQPYVAIAFGAFAATFTDFLTENVMVGKLHYWRWLDPATLNGAPLQNYLGWFLTSLCALTALYALSARPTSRKEPDIVVLTHIALIATIAFIA